MGPQTWWIVMPGYVQDVTDAELAEAGTRCWKTVSRGRTWEHKVLFQRDPRVNRTPADGNFIGVTWTVVVRDIATGLERRQTFRLVAP